MVAVARSQAERVESADDPAAAFAARLAQAAYDVALRHGVKGSFADLELALWHSMRAAVAADPVRPAAGRP